MILPPMTEETAVQLTMNESGTAILMYKGKLKHTYEWVQYDEQNRALQFVTDEGATQELGMKIHEPFHSFFQNSKELAIITVNKQKKCDSMVKIDFIRLVE